MYHRAKFNSSRVFKIVRRCYTVVFEDDHGVWYRFCLCCVKMWFSIRTSVAEAESGLPIWPKCWGRWTYKRARNKLTRKREVAWWDGHRCGVGDAASPPEGNGNCSLPLLYRLSLWIGLLFRGTLVMLPLPVIGPERLTIRVDTLTSAIVISRTPEITLIAHLKGIDHC